MHKLCRILLQIQALSLCRFTKLHSNTNLSPFPLKALSPFFCQRVYPNCIYVQQPLYSISKPKEETTYQHRIHYKKLLIYIQIITYGFLSVYKFSITYGFIIYKFYIQIHYIWILHTDLLPTDPNPYVITYEIYIPILHTDLLHINFIYGFYIRI